MKTRTILCTAAAVLISTLSAGADPSQSSMSGFYMANFSRTCQSVIHPTHNAGNRYGTAEEAVGTLSLSSDGAARFNGLKVETRIVTGHTTAVTQRNAGFDARWRLKSVDPASSIIVMQLRKHEFFGTYVESSPGFVIEVFLAGHVSGGDKVCLERWHLKRRSS